MKGTEQQEREQDSERREIERKRELYNVHDFASYNTVLHRVVDGIGYVDSETGLGVKTKPRHVSG